MNIERGYLFGSGEMTAFREAVIRWREEVAAVRMRHPGVFGRG